MGKIKVIVADSNYLTCKGLAALIRERTGFTVLTEVRDHSQLLENLSISTPDIIVIDFSSEGFKMDTIRFLNKKHPGIRILAITAEISPTQMAKALDSGATSYVLKNCDQEEITEALYKTFTGERFLCGKIVERLLGASSSAKCDGLNITERELEIIKLITEGYSNKEIAEQLFLSAHTVSTHRKNIMAKLEVNNTAGVVMFAVRENLITPDKLMFSGSQ
jgi:DNA-binding NarL/FixJ family response regulator